VLQHHVEDKERQLSEMPEEEVVREETMKQLQPTVEEKPEKKKDPIIEICKDIFE